LVFLLLSIITIPLVIQQGLPVTREFIIKEEFLETALIATLFVISYFILCGFRQALKTHERAVDLAGEKRSRLVSRMAEAFNLYRHRQHGIAGASILIPRRYAFDVTHATDRVLTTGT
jgi:hypothetical protein